MIPPYRYRAPFVSTWLADLNAPMAVDVEEKTPEGFTIMRCELRRREVKANQPPRTVKERDMPGITVSGGGSYKGLEPGIYNGRCDLIADLGMVETQFGEKHKVYLRFAVPDQVVEKDDGEKFQMSIGISVTASLGKRANLRKMLEAWRGKPFTDEELKGFDLTKLLNAPATIVVGSYAKDGEQRSKIENVLRCKTEVGELLRKPVWYSAETGIEELLEAPEWIREAILAQKDAEENLSKQHEAAQSAADEGGFEDDDIPF